MLDKVGRSHALAHENGAGNSAVSSFGIRTHAKALLMDRDNERERTAFPETKHRVPIAVSEWRGCCYPTFELV